MFDNNTSFLEHVNPWAYIFLDNTLTSKNDMYRIPVMETPPSTSTVGYPIRIVAQRTGLTTPVIRAWERRYEAVSPSRSPAGQRVYSEADVRHLQLLAALVKGGHGIGSIAQLSTERLAELVEEEAAASEAGPLVDAPVLQVQLDQALELVESMRPDELERLLKRAAVTFRTEELIEGLLVPLLRGIGAAWQSGRFGPSSEHVASVTMRRFLEWLSTTVQVDLSSPVLVTGTPAGQRHEFGALLAGLVAADEGWQIRFLGPDLPGDEIARGATAFGAAVVALSAIYPELTRSDVDEVTLLRGRLHPSIDLIIGGPAADPHSARWRESGVLWYPDLDAYRTGLRGLRRPTG